MKPIKLQILNPCHQSWDDMTPAQGGKKFCSQCQKTVTDFSRMSDSEIVNFLKNHGHVCGRLHETQLNRVLMHPANKTRGIWLKIAAAIAAIFFGQHGFAQTPTFQKVDGVVPEMIPEIKIDDPKPAVNNQVNTSVITVKGRVVKLNTGNGVANASVRIDTVEFAITDKDGYFSFTLEKNQLRNDLEITAKKDELYGAIYPDRRDFSRELVIGISVNRYVLGYFINPIDYLEEIPFDPEEALKDSDGDGVINHDDLEPNTTSNTPVDERGVTLDSDKDKIPDNVDSDPVEFDYNSQNYESLSDTIHEIVSPGLSVLAEVILFSENKFEIDGDGEKSLQSIAEVLLKFPNTRLELIPYVDEFSPETYNLNLEKNRAQAIIGYLTALGIAPERITIIYGQSVIRELPVGTSDHIWSRRVELRLIRE